MSRPNKIWLCLVVTALTIVAVSQALYSRHAYAQQPPPNPTPDTCAACCDMPAGGLTIAGPGRGPGFIFASLRPRNICVTVKNDHSAEIYVTFFESALPTVGGLIGIDEKFSKTIPPGWSATVCDSRTAVVTIGCGPTPCSLDKVRWRVDKAE